MGIAFDQNIVDGRGFDARSFDEGVPAVSTASRKASTATKPVARGFPSQVTSFDDIKSSKAALPLPVLARLASADDKQAQLQLGIRFEEGRGVERNLKKAKKLYGKAASDSGGQIWVYSPPVGNSPGRVIPLDIGPKQFGLAEAERRLEGLNAHN